MALASTTNSNKWAVQYTQSWFWHNSSGLDQNYGSVCGGFNQEHRSYATGDKTL